MPRNSSGIYTLPGGNPVTPGDVIEAEWANTTLEDVADALTNSLSRTGAGGMLAPFRIADGSISGPGLSFLNETNTGLYRLSSGSAWMAVLGVNTAQFSTVGLTIPFGKALTAQGNASVGGTLAVTGATTLGSTLAVTGAITATGGVVGNVTGNVTAGSGTSTFNNVTISGSLDMDAGSSASITGLSTPTNASDAANKGYVDAQVATRLALTGGTMTGAIAMSNYGITGLATPSNDQDAATKAYVDSVAQGIDAKASCKAGTTGNITLGGLQIIDSVVCAAGDRVLVKDQTSAAQNGIYVVASGAWQRAADANTWDELVSAFTFVEQGTVNGNNGYICTISAGGTLGTTPVTWAQFSGAGQINAGPGLSKSGNTIQVNTASSSRIVVGADDIDLATTGVSAGTYKSVTVDAYGRVTGGTNPTTLSGYGISDAYTSSQVDTLVNAKLSLTGGTMSGAIAMGANKITGMADPTNPQDAATKSYIDTIFGSTTTAAASAAAAASSASAAATSATNAASSATAAAGSATSAASSYTTFNNQYLGSKSSDPSTNNTGGALVAGNLYWNSTSSEMRVYNGSAWVAAYLPAAGYLALSGGTMTGNITFAAGQTWPTFNQNTTGNAATATTATNVSGGTASVTTLTASSTVTLSAGTAQNIPYLNASKQIAYNANFVLDTSGNFGVGTSAPKLRVQWSAAGADNAPVLGSAKGIGYFTNNDANYGLLVGNSSATGEAWFQAQRTDGTATAYDISLNPAGGDVKVGTRLLVNGITVGRGAGAVATNTAVGASALAANTSGSSVTGVGYQALTANTSGNNSVAFGVQALRVNTTGNDNSAFGTGALYSSTTGSANTAIGKDALVSNTTSSYNTAVGYQAGYSTTGQGNSFFGQSTGYGNTTGANNNAFGSGALYGNTSGSYNCAFGGGQTGVYGGSLGANTTGSLNTAVGNSALASNTTANDNTAVGYRALYSNTTGTVNTAIGGQVTGYWNAALYANTTGNWNVALGNGALSANTTASNNTGLGGQALLNNTTGANNVSIGKDSLYTNTTSSNNTAVGYQALYSTTGPSNVGLGYTAGTSITSGTGSICIGSGSNVAAGTDNYEIVIGYNSTGKGSATAFINAFGGGTYNGANSSSWATTSDERIKTGFKAVTNGLEVINALEPFEFDYIVTGKHDVGFKAQQYMTVLPEQVSKHKASPEEKAIVGEDEIYGIQRNLDAYFVSAIKALTAQVETLKAEIATLKGN